MTTANLLLSKKKYTQLFHLDKYWTNIEKAPDAVQYSLENHFTANTWLVLLAGFDGDNIYSQTGIKLCESCGLSHIPSICQIEVFFATQKAQRVDINNTMR